MALKRKPWILPVPVYQHNSTTHQYELTGCFAYAVPMHALPSILNCSSSMGILSENMSLLKAAMRAPAVVLVNGTHSKAYCSGGEPLDALPLMSRHDSLIIRAFEMTCVNLTSQLATYRLRADGELVLSGIGEMNCITTYVAPIITMSSLKKYLKLRADAIRKTLRDRRIVVTLSAERVRVYSLETLLPKGVVVTKDANSNKDP